MRLLRNMGLDYGSLTIDKVNTLMPGSKPFFRRLRRTACGVEKMALQGMSVGFSSPHDPTSESQKSDLAGNAWNTTVFSAATLSVLANFNWEWGSIARDRDRKR